MAVGVVRNGQNSWRPREGQPLTEGIKISLAEANVAENQHRQKNRSRQLRLRTLSV